MIEKRINDGRGRRISKKILLNACRSKHILIGLLEDGTLIVQEEDRLNHLFLESTMTQ
jgi:hypothetical protein